MIIAFYLLVAYYCCNSARDVLVGGGLAEQSFGLDA